LPETLNIGHSRLFVDVCGMSSIAPLFVAKEQAVACYSDDAVIRAIGRLENRTAGFCTQAFLRVAVERGVFTVSEYQDAMIKLIESNYTFISEDAGILRRIYDRAGGRFTPLALSLINRVNDPQYAAKSCLPLLAEFSVYVWSNKAPESANPGEDWVMEVWQAISKARDSEPLLLEFVARIAVASFMRPAIFVGVVLYAILHVPSVQRHRFELFVMMQQAIDSVARVTAQIYPFWPGLSQGWIQHGRLNKILMRQGFLNISMT